MVNRHRLLFLALGMGMGIVIANMIHIFNPPVEYVEYSEEEIVSRAKELGMVFIKESIDTDSENKESEEELYNNVTGNEDMEFTVEAGDTLEEIAQKLYDLKLIDSAKNFSQYARARGVDKSLRAGSYKISHNLDYETIIAILMKKQ